ncbi:hypothetical protein TrLO_g12617 [Triparma laevis f. longispina]|uniref:Uncharacterized protein n=1 Tax=Triparma laevis f. longispina TaxID=1714387 RepID=A0A9W7ARL7_9STRA|nr:hypothetical protein TrLO_g12617 [Triparma laevis f. longispina]
MLRAGRGVGGSVSGSATVILAGLVAAAIIGLFLTGTRKLKIGREEKAVRPSPPKPATKSPTPPTQSPTQSLGPTPLTPQNQPNPNAKTPALQAGSNCFCDSDAKEDLANSYCNNGSNMQRFCPNAVDHGDGRTQSCVWSGWSIGPQTGDIEADCQAWGAVKVGDPRSKAIHDNEKILEYNKIEPGVTVKGTTISGAAAIFICTGAYFTKKRKMRTAQPQTDDLEMRGKNVV